MTFGFFCSILVTDAYSFICRGRCEITHFWSEKRIIYETVSRSIMSCLTDQLCQSHSSPNAQQCASVIVTTVISHVINTSCGCSTLLLRFGNNDSWPRRYPKTIFFPRARGSAAPTRVSRRDGDALQPVRQPFILQRAGGTVTKKCYTCF